MGPKLKFINRKPELNARAMPGWFRRLFSDLFKKNTKKNLFLLPLYHHVF